MSVRILYHFLRDFEDIVVLPRQLTNKKEITQFLLEVIRFKPVLFNQLRTCLCLGFGRKTLFLIHIHVHVVILHCCLLYWFVLLLYSFPFYSVYIYLIKTINIKTVTHFSVYLKTEHLFATQLGWVEFRCQI